MDTVHETDCGILVQTVDTAPTRRPASLACRAWDGLVPARSRPCLAPGNGTNFGVLLSYDIARDGQQTVAKTAAFVTRQRPDVPFTAVSAVGTTALPSGSTRTSTRVLRSVSCAPCVRARRFWSHWQCWGRRLSYSSIHQPCAQRTGHGGPDAPSGTEGLLIAAYTCVNMPASIHDTRCDMA
jgi:hypothetical protein